MGEHWTIISKNNCPWCDKAKELLNERGIAYEEVNIDSENGTEAASGRHILRVNKVKTVPQCFNGPILIGGYEALERYFNER